MNYILDTMHRIRDPKKSQARWKKYREYLESIKDKLPPATYAYATAEWHYDSLDHRCPHDGWVESVTIQEVRTKTKVPGRRIDIYVTLLGGYHDGNVELRYRDVYSYNLNKSYSYDYWPSYNKGHNDWLIDEIRLSEHGLVEHEVKFWLRTRWLIECKELKYTWKPFKKNRA